MLILLTTLYVLRRTLAVPVPGSISEDRAASTGTSRRSLGNIIWSCIVTIFACTWVAVHPNVPTPEQQANRRWYSRPLRRARIMLYTLIAPEFVIMWAWRQRIAACRTSQTLEEWSRVHGFFLVMGGFIDGEQVLSLDRIEQLVQNGEIEYPIVSRQEIQDRSKGDAVTKALVVSQTTWFLLQCTVRASQHLAMTELELATAAFALLNIVMYVLWWDKPLDVQYPIRVRRNGNAETGEEHAQTQEENESTTEWNWQSCLRGWSRVNILYVVQPFFVMMGADEDDMFSVVGDPESYDNKTRVSMWMGITLVSTVFGGIHCIGWSFDFPSHTEELLWQISSLIITGIPLWFTLIDVTVHVDHIGAVSGILVFFIFLLYILVRVLLLVLCLTTLRSLPSSAFQTVEWTTSLPHV